MPVETLERSIIVGSQKLVTFEVGCVSNAAIAPVFAQVRSSCHGTPIFVALIAYLHQVPLAVR